MLCASISWQSTRRPLGGGSMSSPRKHRYGGRGSMARTASTMACRASATFMPDTTKADVRVPKGNSKFCRWPTQSRDVVPSVGTPMIMCGGACGAAASGVGSRRGVLNSAASGAMGVPQRSERSSYSPWSVASRRFQNACPMLARAGPSGAVSWRMAFQRSHWSPGQTRIASVPSGSARQWEMARAAAASASSSTVTDTTRCAECGLRTIVVASAQSVEHRSGPTNATW